ncbi:hypothetical protein D621_11105 [beta proteobacterium AAP51]|nr:hypothetical protein D621_11105 [beta proteobacterium AAP51]
MARGRLWQALRQRWVRWRRALLVFSTGQLSVQLLGFVTGLFVLRWMTADEYAKAGVVLGFQTVFTALVDLGVGGALVALIGQRGHEPQTVGAYVAAARWWRAWLLLGLLPLGAWAFLVLAHRQGWPAHEAALLYLGLAVALFYAGVTAWATAPLLLNQRLGAMYLALNAGALMRLMGAWALHRAGQLDALSLTLLGTLSSLLTAGLCWHAARRHVQAPPASSAATRLEIRRYVAPLVPLTVFYALQGQLGIFLMAWFGQAQQVAEVTALGRLGQLFAFLSALFGMLVMPLFARMPVAVFVSRYGWAVAATLLLALLLTAAAFALPEPLLWLLGPRYGHLLQEVPFIVLAGALGFAGGALWSIHAARKWVFWRATAFYIAGVLATQLLFVALVDLSTTRNVVLMGVATNAAGLLAQGLVAWLGLRQHRAHPIPQT